MEELGLKKGKWWLYSLLSFLFAVFSPLVIFFFLTFCAWAGRFASEVFVSFNQTFGDFWGALIYSMVLLFLCFSELLLHEISTCKGDVNLAAKIRKNVNFLRLLLDVGIVFLGTAITTFIALPLGCEGPSVFMISCLGFGFATFAGKKDEWIGECGGAFGYCLAFFNPFAGFLFYLEAMGAYRRKKWGLFLYEIALLAVGYLVLVLFNWLIGGSRISWFTSFFNFGISFMDEPMGWLLLLGAPLLCPAFAWLLNALAKAIHPLFANRNLNGILVATLLAVLIPLALRLSGNNPLLGNGSNLFTLSFSNPKDGLLILFGALVFRFFYLSSSFNFYHLGGQAIPTLMFGALIGRGFAYLFLGNGVYLSSNSVDTITIAFAICFYACSTKYYLTSGALIFSFGNPVFLALPVWLPLALSYFVNRTLGTESMEKGLHQSERLCYEEGRYLLLPNRN